MQGTNTWPPKFLAAALLAVTVQSCFPNHLQKYQSESHETRLESEVREVPSSTSEERIVQTPTKPKVMEQIDSKTYRFRAAEGAVWDAAMAVLVHDYNINLVDRQSGLITTEWDIAKAAGINRRNKISLLVRRLSWQEAEIIIHNNEEIAPLSSEDSWSKYGGESQETARIAKNIAFRLGAKSMSDLSIKEQESIEPSPEL